MTLRTVAFGIIISSKKMFFVVIEGAVIDGFADFIDGMPDAMLVMDAR